MKRFTEYLNEDFDPAIFNADGGISITDPSVIDAINSNLEMSTGCDCRTPYIALEEVRKVLAYYKIFLPKSVFLDQNHGNDVFEVSQFGEKTGMNNQGEVVTADNYPLFVYFEWSLNEKGLYDTFASVVDQNELDEILSDYDSEVESDDDLQEEHSMGSNSKMLYKLVNKMKSEKQSDDVDSYIEHEKQGKTFTQMNEEPMPDLKKKMGAKKVTLSNMMKKEEKDEPPFDMPTEKPSTPYKNKGAKAKQLARAAMKKAMKKSKKENLQELAGKSKEAMKAIKNRLEKKHDAEWEATYEKRKKEKLKGSEKTKKEDKSRNDLAKRWLRADRAEKKLEEEQLDEISKKKLGQYIKAASHDVATKSAATGRYADRANRARDEMKKGEYKNWPQGKKDDEFADKMFKKSWNRRKGIAKAVDKITK